METNEFETIKEIGLEGIITNDFMHIKKGEKAPSANDFRDNCASSIFCYSDYTRMGGPRFVFTSFWNNV